MTETVSERGQAVADKTMLIVDDDSPFRERLAQAMERRGYQVATADSVAAGIEAADHPPAPAAS